MDSIETMQRVIDEAKRIVNNVSPDQLGNKTTCTEWTVKDLINHITGGATMVGISIEKGSVPDDVIGSVMSNADCLGDDYKGAFTAAADKFSRIMNVPGALDKEVQLPFGTMPGEAALSFGIYDVSTHNCDIARATGQKVQDTEVLEAALGIGQQLVQPEFRAPGIFDAEKDCSTDAPVEDRLLAFGGRQL
jgi:uncharacterized protein (TIGR03086 family)